MKVVYIHQYFKTYTEGGSSRSYYLAKALADNGVEVELITSHNEKSYKCTTVDGIRVHYLPVYYDNHLGFLGRIKSFVAFMWQAYRFASQIEEVDYCYASSTPLTIGVVALLLKRQKNIPYYFEVRDLWPLAPVQLGVIRNRFLQKVLSWLEQKVYQHAFELVALSPGIAAHIRRRVPNKKVHLLPNISDCGFFQKEDKKIELSHKYNVAHKFVVTYFGAVGQVNQLRSLVEIARTAQEAQLHDLAFLVVGRGNQLAEIQKLVCTYNLTNFQFIPHVSKYQLCEIMNVTDAVYVSFASYPVLETSSPNKFFDSLAAGKLCITNTAGWIAKLVQEHECGFYVHPDTPADFLKKISYYLNDSDALEQAQYNARQLAESQFSREKLTRQFVQIFLNHLPAVFPTNADVIYE